MVPGLGCGPSALGGEVTDGAAGVGSGEVVLVMPVWGPLVLEGEVTDGVVGVGSGEAVLVMLGWGVRLSGTSVSLVIVSGAVVGTGKGDGARVAPYSSSVDRYSPTKMHSSTEAESLRSPRSFSAQSN